MHLYLIKQVSLVRPVIVTLYLLLRVDVLVELRGGLLLLRILAVAVVAPVHRVILVLLGCMWLVAVVLCIITVERFLISVVVVLHQEVLCEVFRREFSCTTVSNGLILGRLLLLVHFAHDLLGLEVRVEINKLLPHILDHDHLLYE